MIRGAVLFSCLLFAACDGGKDEEKKTSSRSEATKRSRTEDAEARRRRVIEAAARDPQVRTLLAKIKAAPLPETPDGDLPTDAFALVKLYAEKYPEAGVEWLVGREPNTRGLWGMFAEAVLAVDRAKALALVDRVPEGRARDTYVMTLAMQLSASEAEQLWRMVQDPAKVLELRDSLSTLLLSRVAAVDPQGAWELARTQRGTPPSEGVFLARMGSLEPGVPYPIDLLERVPPGVERVSAVRTAVAIIRNEEALAPLAQWAERQPDAEDMGGIYESLRRWHQGKLDSAGAQYWAEKRAQWLQAGGDRR